MKGLEKVKRMQLPKQVGTGTQQVRMGAGARRLRMERMKMSSSARWSVRFKRC